MKWVERVLGENVRSRLCAMEFNVFFRADVHAGTPPIGVIRLLLSLAASRPNKTGLLGIYDITCAFLQTRM